MAGLASVLALPPIHAIFLLWVSFPALLLILDKATNARQAAMVGWWYGFAFFSAGLYWIAYALLVDPVHFGWMIPFAIFGLGGFLALFEAAVTFLTWRLTRPGFWRIFALAFFWTLMEWVRSWIFSGFPWNQMASTWVSFPTILQFASIGGAFGLSFLTVFCAALPYLLRQSPIRGSIATVIGIILLSVIAFWGWNRIPQEPLSNVPDIRLRLVQGNIAQVMKWYPGLAEEHLRHHLRLSRSSGFDQITHVIWPETAAPPLLDESDWTRIFIADRAIPDGGTLLTGTVRRELSENGTAKWFNSLQIIDHKGTIIANYDKAHLVPFGEYVPASNFLPIAKIVPGIGDYSSGPGPQTLSIPGLPPFSPLICYEDIFPFASTDARHHPDWILNITNDGWFGNSAGPWQHLAAAQLRAVEQGVPLIRVANTGISAVIDPYGRILSSIPLGQEGVLDSPLPMPLKKVPVFSRFVSLVR